MTKINQQLTVTGAAFMAAVGRLHRAELPGLGPHRGRQRGAEGQGHGAMVMATTGDDYHG